MIQSYKEEINARKNKAAIFWFIVFIFSCFLYLFFQGYYIDINFKESPREITDKSILKQFGIVNMQVFPEPEFIYLSGATYSNGNKSKFDYGIYKAEIYNKGYIPVVFNIVINRNFPIFYETINLFKKMVYRKIPHSFDEINKVDDYYFVFSKNDKLLRILDSSYHLYNSLVNEYAYIGYKYFSNNGMVHYYDFDSNLIKPYLSKETKVGIYCRNARVYHDRLFCYDNMDFIDGSKMKGDDKVLRINDNLILTEKYLYNNGNGGDWGTYEHSSKLIFDPQDVVQIDKMPYILEDGLLYQIDKNNKIQFKLKEIDVIKKAFQFGQELVLVGYKGSQVVFILNDGKHIYTGKLGSIDPSKVFVHKINGVFFINTVKSVYIYYKGSLDFKKILNAEDIKIIDNQAFFKKEGKNYNLNFIEE